MERIYDYFDGDIVHKVTRTELDTLIQKDEEIRRLKKELAHKVALKMDREIMKSS